MKRSPIRRVSEKALQSGELGFNSTIRRTTVRIARRRSRRKSNAVKQGKRFAHDYGSVERRDWIKAQPCVLCRVFGAPPASAGRPRALRDNMHTGKKPGKGLKTHYTTILPGCRPHHRMYDRYIAPFDNPDVRAAVEALAPGVEAEWLSIGAPAEFTLHETAHA